MKYARKMVLVDANTVQPKPADPVTDAINKLISANEFNRATFGPNALALSYLDKEMKEILDNKVLTPQERLIEYNQRLQRYLFLLRESGVNAPTYSERTISPEPQSAPSRHTSTAAATATAATSTPTFTYNPISPTYNPFSPTVESTASTPVRRRTNLPRVTPKEQRLRQVRRKNSRFKDFFVNWKGLDSELEDEEENYEG